MNVTHSFVNKFPVENSNHLYSCIYNFYFDKQQDTISAHNKSDSLEYTTYN